MKQAQFLSCPDCRGPLLNLGEAATCKTGLQVLEANSVEANTAHDIPHFGTINEQVLIEVGRTETHPMQADHYIMWIYLQTQNGGHLRTLKPTDEPRAIFAVKPAEVCGVFAYCSKHGLWQADPASINYHEEEACSLEQPHACIES